MSKQEIINAIDMARKVVTKEVIAAIKTGDCTNARKYTTTIRHLDITADLLGKRNG